MNYSNQINNYNQMDIIKKVLINDEQDDEISEQISKKIMNNNIVCYDDEDCDIFDENELNKENKY